MSVSQRKPYSGLERKLIIAFDIGTTFSGASYVILIPGESPVIQGVTKFPGQPKVGGDSKIPSVVCYDEDGNVVAVGSEADPDTNPDLSEVEGLFRAEWFKLHLRPSHLVAEQCLNVDDIPALPPNKTVVDIISDLLRYLYKSTKQYIRERQGDDIWESVGTNVEFILSHPNGWEGKQQSEMRRAAVSAGLVASLAEASEQISFVTEGEASLHFCLNKISVALKKYAHDGILIADCGGGTVDISTYGRSSGGNFKELAPAECLLQGSVFVTHRAQGFLTAKLQGSQFGTPEDINVMTRYFDQTTKPSFKGSVKPLFIRFGRKENDPEFDIRSGGVKMNGAQIANFFEPAVQSIIEAIEEQIRKAEIAIKAIFMVGGFATSDYLFSKLEHHFKVKGVDILRPDAYLNKAVAEGAIIFKVDHAVSSRVARYTYGIRACEDFDPTRPDHLARESTCIEAPSGEILIPHCFSAILQKGTEVAEETEFRETYTIVFSSSAFHSLQTRSVKIKCYRNRKDNTPTWIDEDPVHFTDLCEVTADVTKVKNLIEPQYNRHGSKYYSLTYDIVLLFGLTELKAQIAWIENGKEKRGPASVVYDADSIVNP